MKEAEQPTMAQSYEDLKSSWDLSRPGARRERTVFLPRTVISHMSMNKSAEMDCPTREGWLKKECSLAPLSVFIKQNTFLPGRYPKFYGALC